MPGDQVVPSNERSRTRSPFFVGTSVSKSFFAAALVRCVDLGLVLDVGEPDRAVGGPGGGGEVVLGAPAGQADRGLLPLDGRLVVEEQVPPGPTQVRRLERERPRTPIGR